MSEQSWAYETSELTISTPAAQLVVVLLQFDQRIQRLILRSIKLVVGRHFTDQSIGRVGADGENSCASMVEDGVALLWTNCQRNVLVGRGIASCRGALSGLPLWPEDKPLIPSPPGKTVADKPLCMSSKLRE